MNLELQAELIVRGTAKCQKILIHFFLATEIFVWLANFQFLFSGSNGKGFCFVFGGVAGSNLG
jgi:hypothetical protein